MKKFLKSAATCSKRERVLRLVTNDKSGLFPPNMECIARLADALPLGVPAWLFFRITDALRGHSKGMARLMTTNIILFCIGSGRHLTGITHVDDQLLALYRDLYNFVRKEMYYDNEQ